MEEGQGKSAGPAGDEPDIPAGVCAAIIVVVILMSIALLSLLLVSKSQTRSQINNTVIGQRPHRTCGRIGTAVQKYLLGP